MNYLKGWLVWFAIFLPFHGEESYLGTYGSEINLMNIDKVWAQNITGRNIIVAVVDDGVNYNHQDLNPNYESSISYDFVGNDMLPMPEGKMGHGTKCAGVIAAHIGGICRTGVAYNAKLAGIRIFNESFPDENRTAAGFEHMRNEIDIYSNSWGPSDNGYLIRTLGLREMQSLEQGVNHGRGGLGSIFVFSSGNGGLFGDSCAFDGYVNNINTIAIGAFSKKGVPQYAEHCSSVMAAAYGDYVKTCSGRFSRCVDDFGRTSAAAAFASGIIALLLEANNNLTQRDVQHLIVRTSNPRTANINRREWAINGAGLMVHPAVGFGVLNAQRLVEVARNNWRTVPQQRDRSTELNNLPKLIFRGGTNFTFSFGDATESLKIKAIERVQVKVSLNFSPRAMMEMYIISPQGTKSQLLYTRMYDAITARKNYEGLVITTLHFWGECPAGEWTVLFKAAESMRSRGSSYGTLQKFTVTIYGTDQDPLLYNNVLPKDTIKCGGGNQLWKGYGSKCCESMWTYDPNYETCCPGTYEIVKIRSQCGSTPYNKCENICCNGILHNKFKNNATMSCCGKKSHDKKKTICCGEMLSKRYSCKKVYFWLAKYLYEAKCYGGRSVQYQFTAEQCKNRKILKKVCEDKLEFCKPYHCIILSSSQKTANCAKTCDLC